MRRSTSATVRAASAARASARSAAAFAWAACAAVFSETTCRAAFLDSSSCVFCARSWGWVKRVSVECCCPARTRSACGLGRPPLGGAQLVARDVPLLGERGEPLELLRRLLRLPPGPLDGGRGLLHLERGDAVDEGLQVELGAGEGRRGLEALALLRGEEGAQRLARLLGLAGGLDEAGAGDLQLAAEGGVVEADEERPGRDPAFPPGRARRPSSRPPRPRGRSSRRGPGRGGRRRRR